MIDRDGERITRLETHYEHLSGQMNEMNKTLKDVHEVLTKAKGAKWAILGMASLAGFLSAKFGAIAALFTVAK